MHAEPAADDDPGVGFAHQFQRGALARVRAQAEADRRGAAAEGQKPPGRGDQLAISRRVGDLLWRDIVLAATAVRMPIEIRWP